MKYRVVRTLPFRGEFGDFLDIHELAVQNRAGRSRRLLRALLRDPHLAALDPDLDFAGVLLRARRGTFDAESFLSEGRRAIAAYVGRARADLAAAFTRDASNIDVILEQKLIPITRALSSPADRTALAIPLRPSKRVKTLFHRATYPVPLTPVTGATIVYPCNGSSAPSRYAWRMSTPHDAPSRSSATARAEVGRAVYVDDVDVNPRTGAVLPARTEPRANHIRTQVVVKGIGPTRFADNRFSKRASGVFTLPQGKRDWEHSEILARGGVPVYRPLELALLPYCDWHPSMGWRPMAIYARLPLENLRISDLELLSDKGKREVIADLRSKLAALSGISARWIAPTNVLTFFVARLGRIAGLFESGRTLGGRPFFHGFLHPQNVSLLGEIVDLGEGCFVNSQRELRAAYAASGYVNPERAWPSRIRRARHEAVVFRHLASLFADRVSPVIPLDSSMRRDLDAIFRRSHREGLGGMRADRAQDLFRVSNASRAG